MESALFIKDLQITINKRKIIDFKNQSISIEWGDKVALLGKNGAGKSTLINAVLEKIQYSGIIERSFNNNDIGIVFQNNEYSDLIKVKELIRLVFDANKNKSTDYFQFCHDYNLVNLQNKFVKDLSVGERQRLTAGLVLSQQKKIYFLDELTSGLDYEKRESLKQMVLQKTKDATVIQVTHYFEEIENWANKVLILNKGELIFNGNLKSFYADYSHFSCIKAEGNFDNNLMEKLKEKNPGVKVTQDSFFVNNLAQQEKITTLLSDLGVSYHVKNRNIYTTYLLALEGRNK